MEGEWGKWQLLILMQDIQSTSHHIFNKTNIDYQTYLPYLYQSHQHQPQWTHNPNNPPSPTALQNVRHPPSPILPFSQSLTDSVARRQSHAEADAARAMDHTNSWTPTTASFTRRQSWKREDQKHELHMTGVLADVKTGQGFTER